MRLKIVLKNDQVLTVDNADIDYKTFLEIFDSEAQKEVWCFENENICFLVSKYQVVYIEVDKKNQGSPPKIP